MRTTDHSAKRQRDEGARLTVTLREELACARGDAARAKEETARAKEEAAAAVERANAAVDRAEKTEKRLGEKTAPLDVAVGTARMDAIEKNHAGKTKMTKEIASLKEKVTALERDLASASTAAANWKEKAETLERRYGAFDGVVRDAQEARARADACEARATAAESREAIARACAQDAEMARATLEGELDAKVQNAVASAAVEKERALEDVVRGLKNELAEAKATRDRAVGLAAAAEEHEAEVYAGEALRLRKEAHDARRAEAATRRELEDLRRDAAASSTAKDAALNDARAALDAAQGRARAIERAANDEIETLRGALRAAREATEMERASISVGEAKRARERAEEEQVRTTSTVPTIFFLSPIALGFNV